MTGWQGGGSSRQRCGPPRAARWNAAPSRAWRGAARHPRPRATPRVWRRGCGERGRVGRTRAARGGGGAARCDEEDGARRHHRSGVHRGRLRWGLWVLVRAHPPRRPTWKPGPTDATRDGPSSAAAAVWPAPHTRGERVWSWPLAAPAPGRDGGGSSHWSQLDCHGTSGSWPRCLRMGAAAACVGGGGGGVATATVPSLAAPVIRWACTVVGASEAPRRLSRGSGVESWLWPMGGPLRRLVVTLGMLSGGPLCG